jgi:hypothetical protein
MKMLRKLIYSAATLLLSAAVVTAQGDACSAFVETALKAAQDACPSYEHYTACLAHESVQASVKPQVNGVPFEQVGEKVDIRSLTSLQTSPLDIEEGTWGLTFFSMPYAAIARRPDPNLHVPIVLYGDATLEMDTLVLLPVRENVGTTVNIRREPNADSEIVERLEPGMEMMASARLEDSSWVRLILPLPEGPPGWVKRELVTVEGEVEYLPVASSDLVRDSRFMLKNGTDARCANLPAGGLLVQSDAPEFWIYLGHLVILSPNTTLSVRVLDSVQILGDSRPRSYIAYYVLRGGLTVWQSSQDYSPLVDEGLVAYVPLDLDGSARPNEVFVQSYTQQDIAGVMPLLAVLPHPINPAAPAAIPADWVRIMPANRVTPTPVPDYGASGLIEGTWQFNRYYTDATCTEAIDEMSLPEGDFTVAVRLLKAGEAVETLDDVSEPVIYTATSDGEFLVLEGMTQSLPIVLKRTSLNQYYTVRSYAGFRMEFISTSRATVKVEKTSRIIELGKCGLGGLEIASFDGTKVE